MIKGKEGRKEEMEDYVEQLLFLENFLFNGVTFSYFFMIIS